MAILNDEYKDILGINPKYNYILWNHLTPAGEKVVRVVFNLCANSILHYDEIRARGFAGSYTFGIGKNKNGEFYPQSFTASNINYYGGISASGATLSKLVNLGLLEIASKGSVREYRIPEDLFTTNDLRIKFKSKNNEDF